MIDFIRGKLVRIAPMTVIVDVGGLGLRLTVPMGTSTAFGQRATGEVVELLIVLHIQTTDPGIHLFGFQNEGERAFFELLRTVKGVGPALAMRTLSGASVVELRDAILLQDAARLTRIKGIGKKTAERILFDLKDKVALLGDLEPSTAPGRASPAREEALLAMTALGYDAREARQAVEAANRKLGEQASSEELVRQALQEIA